MGIFSPGRRHGRGRDLWRAGYSAERLAKTPLTSLAGGIHENNVFGECATHWDEKETAAWDSR